MTTEPDRAPARLGADPLDLAAELPLSGVQQPEEFVAAVRTRL